jgi:hypothetical protein
LVAIYTHAQARRRLGLLQVDQIDVDQVAQEPGWLAVGHPDGHQQATLPGEVGGKTPRHSAFPNVEAR